MDILKSLREHFSKTTKEERESIWKEIDNMDFDGPNAFEYIDYLDKMESDSKKTDLQKSIQREYNKMHLSPGDDITEALQELANKFNITYDELLTLIEL